MSGTKGSSISAQWHYSCLWMATVIWFPAAAQDFSLLQSIQTNTGSHPASYWMDIRGSFHVVRWLGHTTGRGPYSARIKNVWSYTTICLMSSWYAQTQFYLVLMLHTDVWVIFLPAHGHFEEEGVLALLGIEPQLLRCMDHSLVTTLCYPSSWYYTQQSHYNKEV